MPEKERASLIRAGKKALSAKPQSKVKQKARRE
jgi:hypothetical protein